MTHTEHTPETTPAPSAGTPVRIDADHTLTKRLGNWTRARAFEVRIRRGAAVVDLRSPDIADGDLDLHVNIDHGMLKLLVASDTVIDHFGSLQWNGRGRVKDMEGASGSEGRRIHVTGQITSGEIRVHRNGIAILSAMFSRAWVQDALRARREGGYTTVDDPTRAAS